MDEKQEYKHVFDWIMPGLKKEKEMTEKGGDGSGNFGHAGRPGKVGGSASTAMGTGLLDEDTEEDMSKPQSRGDVQTMYSKLIKEGGFTVQPVTNDSPTKGFVLSIYPEREAIYDADKVSPKTIRDYLRKNIDFIKGNPKRHLGGWLDGGKVYLDISEIVNNAEEAMRLCKEHKQLAFFDLEKMETIFVKPEEKKEKEESGGKPVRFDFPHDATEEEIVAGIMKLLGIENWEEEEGGEE